MERSPAVWFTGHITKTLNRGAVTMGRTFVARGHNAFGRMVTVHSFSLVFKNSGESAKYRLTC